MKNIQLTVNGKAVSAVVEPRLQLADFLREHLMLTGTHLGCEHGVCGACTVEIDGAPARSCIAYAVACGGSDVRTIEGFDDDAVMAELREAFSAEHALQCGYCTPGMLVTARDIVLRLPHADEACIRTALAGNLCRCTGYVGIVRAIRSVIAKRSASGEADGALRIAVQPVRAEALSARPATVPPVRAASAATTAGAEDYARPQAVLRQSFTVDHPRETVWNFFGRLDEVTTCLPGTSILGTPADDRVEFRVRMKVGPIMPEFEGAADVARNASDYSGMIRGSARDTRSSSTTRGEIRYILAEEKSGAATRVDIEVAYTLTGPLAQFGRSSIVQDIARRMTAAFAQNLAARLDPREAGAALGPARGAAELDAGSLVFSVFVERIRNFFRALFRR
jgi:carbon-monoxide dehydrogenase small subunit